MRCALTFDRGLINNQRTININPSVGVFDMRCSGLRFFLFCCLWVAAVFSLTAAGAGAQGIIIDHTCTDLSKIPDTWINQVKSNLKIHYAHTSHGEQISVGLERLSNSNGKYAFYPDNCTMPDTTQYLSMMDGQYMYGYCETYVTPEYYWQGSGALNITRSNLNAGDINVSMWAWCSQVDYYSAPEVQSYLDAMSQLEREYPDVTFVYFTGNAQSGEQNRVDRNNQIRDYCRNNNKILFDFADLDCWYNGNQYVENGIPMEHPQYHGDEAGHTTFGSCENKGNAFWWLLARIAGWDGEEGGGGIVDPLDLGITANGATGSVTVSQETPVSVQISVSSGTSQGQNADWWIAVSTPNEAPYNWYTYVYGSGWLPGLNVCIQIPVFDLASHEVFSGTLSPGNYTFYFAMDAPDGIPSGPWWDLDAVNVEVTP